MAENGAAVTRDVETAQDAILWLWKAHNRVNVRLKDDVSDDPVFPKKVFPDKENCPACYNEKVIKTNHVYDAYLHSRHANSSFDTSSQNCKKNLLTTFG